MKEKTPLITEVQDEVKALSDFLLRAFKCLTDRSDWGELLSREQQEKTLLVLVSFFKCETHTNNQGDRELFLHQSVQSNLNYVVSPGAETQQRYVLCVEKTGQTLNDHKL